MTSNQKKYLLFRYKSEFFFLFLYSSYITLLLLCTAFSFNSLREKCISLSIFFPKGRKYSITLTKKTVRKNDIEKVRKKAIILNNVIE